MNNEQIRIVGITELLEAEKPQMVPYYTLAYLASVNKKAGLHFRLLLKSEDEQIPDFGSSYYNELKVEKIGGSSSRGCGCGSSEEDEKDRVVYFTGMLRWRAGHRDSLDNPENYIGDPSIIEETEHEVIFGYRTGVNVKVFRFVLKDERCDHLESFDINGHLKSLKRSMLAREAIDDQWKFGKYVEKILGRKWWTEQSKWDCLNRWIVLNDDTAILFASHYEKDNDPEVDQYKFFVWKKGKGIGFSESYETGLYNSKRDFILEIGYEASLEGNILTIDATNERYGFHQRRTFEIVE